MVKMVVSGVIKDIIMLLMLVFSETFRLIINFTIWLEVFSKFKSILPTWKMIFSRFTSLIVGYAWSYRHCTFAKLYDSTFSNNSIFMVNCFYCKKANQIFKNVVTKNGCFVVTIFIATSFITITINFFLWLLFRIS